MNEYEKKAQEFLDQAGITFQAVLIGSDCPGFCEDFGKGIDLGKVDTYPRKTHIHGKHYRCTFTRATRPIGHEAEQRTGKWQPGTLVIDFWNSYADEEFNAWRFGKVEGQKDYPYWDKFSKQRHQPRKTPTPYDVLTCVEKNEPATFEEWCSELGYDSDSRKAEKVYQAVQVEWRKVQQFFSAAEIEQLQEIQ